MCLSGQPKTNNVLFGPTLKPTYMYFQQLATWTETVWGLKNRSSTKMLWETFFTMVHINKGLALTITVFKTKDTVMRYYLCPFGQQEHCGGSSSSCPHVSWYACFEHDLWKIRQEDNEKWVVVQGRSKLFEDGMAKALGGGKHVHRSGGMHLQDNLDTRKSLLRQFYGQKYL